MSWPSLSQHLASEPSLLVVLALVAARPKVTERLLREVTPSLPDRFVDRFTRLFDRLFEDV